MAVIVDDKWEIFESENIGIERKNRYIGPQNLEQKKNLDFCISSYSSPGHSSKKAFFGGNCILKGFNG